jgi:hypothetical protein
VAGEDLDLKGNAITSIARAVQYLIIPTLLDFSCFLWKAESETLVSYYIYSFSFHHRNREEQHIQPIRIKEKVKNRFSLVREYWEVASVIYKPAIVNASRLSKKRWSVGRKRILKHCHHIQVESSKRNFNVQRFMS